MQFRQHPELKNEGFPSWPPLWVDVDQATWTTVAGEVGVLKEVRLRGSDTCRLVLTIEHEGASYLGVLFLSSMPFCLRILEFLNSCIGRSIEEIGGIEFE